MKKSINFKALLNDSKSVSLSTKRYLGQYFRLCEEFVNYGYDEIITGFEDKPVNFKKAHEKVKYEVEHNNILTPSGRILWEKFDTIEKCIEEKRHNHMEELRRKGLLYVKHITKSGSYIIYY